MKVCSPLPLLWAVLFLLCGLADAKTVTLSDGKNLEADFSSETGLLDAIRFQGETLTVPGGSYMPFDVDQDEKETRNEKWVAWGKTEFLGLEQTDAQTVVTRWKADGNWDVSLIWTLDPERQMLGRRMKVTWNGPEEVKIRAFWWRFPTLKIDESAYFFTPGQFPPQRTSLSQDFGKRSAWDRPGIVQLSPKCSAVYFMDYTDPTLDSGSTEVTRIGENEKAGLQVSQVFSIMGRMKPGNTQELGTTWLWFLPTDGETALRKLQEGYARLGIVPPAGTPEEFRKMLLFSFHPGGWIGSNMQDLGGFKKAVPYVDRIVESGANAVWMLPVEDRGIYWPRDYYKFQEGLGTGDEYRALVRRMHDCGLYVMQDCVPHGGSNEFDRAKQHPEWLVYDEDGSTFNYWCFDFNWPTWREYMKNVAKYYMHEYGIDGFRIDAVGGSKIPNWNPEIPYARASFSKLQAGFNMQRSIREGVKEENPQNGGTLAEVGNDFFGLTSDAVYDFAGCYTVFQASRSQNPAEYVKNLRRWLYECRLGGLKDQLRMRHSESHDSLRSQLWYGVQPARAIVALTAMVDGIPLLYQGQEVGNIETYAKIFAIRKALPEMQNANYDYTSVPAPDGVFAVAYEKDGLRSVGFLNFNEKPVRFRHVLGLNSPLEVTEMLSGRTIPVPNREIQVTLPAYGFNVYALRRVDFQPPELKASTAAAKPVSAPENVLELKGSNWSALINSQTGLLTSMTVDGMEVLGKMYGSNLYETPASCFFRNKKTIVLERRLGSSACRFTYQNENDRLRFDVEWIGGKAPENTTFFFTCPNAEIWSAKTAEGLLRDRITFRNEENVNVNARHSIYWRPLELDVLYDSLYQPLWRGSYLGAEWQNAAVRFNFDEHSLPARVRWLNHLGGSKGLVAVLSLQGPLDVELPSRFTVTISGNNASGDDVPTDANAQPTTLLPVNGGWLFENEFYALRLTRSGAIAEFKSKKDGGKPIFKSGSLYTDYGFGERGKRFGNENEVEVWSRIETLANGVLRLHFEGRLRQKDRFGRIPQTVSFVTEYTLDKNPTVKMRSKIDAPSLPQAGQAFLSWMMTSEAVNDFSLVKDGKEIASGNPHEAQGRSAQSRELGGVPDEFVLKSDGKPLLSVRNFTGTQPANVFCDRANFFISFCDGQLPENVQPVMNCEWEFEVK